MSADFNECVPDDFTAKSGTMEGSPTCNVTLKFPEGSKFDFVANISILSTFDHLYAQEAWFKVSTLNTLANGDNLIKGNSYLSGIVSAALLLILPLLCLLNSNCRSVLSEITS